MRIKGRDAGENVMPYFKKVIFEKSANRAEINSSYASRGVEDRLYTSLIKEKAILLTGLSMCGKSETAKVLANRFIDEGYGYFHTGDVAEATRYLKSPAIEERICLLEDPFGHIATNPNVSDTWESIKSLISNLQPGRKLLLTSNKLTISSLPRIANSIKGLDLTMSKDEALNLWKYLKKKLVVDEHHKPFECMERYLEECPEDDAPQVGQLIYFINNQGDLKDFNTNAIRHFIALDSERLASKLIEMPPIITDTFINLALASDTITSIHLRELEFVFSDDETFPSLPKKVPFRIQLENRKPAKFPTYGSNLKARQEHIDSIHELEKKGYIHFNVVSESYTFSHPIYYEAARYLIKKIQPGKFQALLYQLKKVMSCLNTPIALHASQQLKFILQSFDNEEYYPRLAVLGEEGLNSIFPAVQNTCQVFMIKMIPHLNDKTKDRVNSLISEGSIHHRLRWHNQIPFTTHQAEFDVSEMTALKSQISDNEFNRVAKLIRAGGRISPREAWEIAFFMQNKNEKQRFYVPAIVLEQLLSFDEVFIREIAAYLIPCSLKKPRFDLLEKFFNDEHPFVVLEAIKGSFLGFSTFTKDMQRRIIALIDDAFSRRDVVITSTHFMTQFGIGYSGNSFDWWLVPKKYQPVMWKLWGRLLPNFFDNLPTNMRFNFARFWSTMEDSMKRLSVEQKLTITASWLQWKIKYLETRYADSFLLGVVDYLFSFAEKVPSGRKPIMRMLIAAKDQYLAAYSLRYFIKHWRILSSQEKAAIISRIKKAEYYYKATALTSSDLSEELQVAILNKKKLSDLISEVDWYQFDANLFHSCLGLLYVDYYFRGLPFNKFEYWHKLLEESLDHRHSTISKLAVKNLLENYFSRINEGGKWKKTPEKIEQILKSDNKELIDFTLLFIVKVVSTYNYIQDEDLMIRINPALSRMKRKYLKGMIDKNIEAIDLSENLFLVDKTIARGLGEFIQKDLRLIRAIQSADKSGSSGNYNEATILSLLTSYLSEESLRLPDTTFRWIDHWLKNDVSKESKMLMPKIEKLRLKLIEIAHEKERKSEEMINKEFSQFYLHNVSV